MKLKHFVLAAAVGLLGYGAVAQTISVPKVSVINPTDLVPVIPLGKPSAQTKYAVPAQITSQSGYVKASPTAGAAGFTFGNTQSYLVLTHATTLATQTVTLAPAPSDGAQECIFAQNAVTALTVSANTGQSIDNAITSIAAAGRACYLFSASSLTWDRSQ